MDLSKDAGRGLSSKLRGLRGTRESSARLADRLYDMPESPWRLKKDVK